MTDEPSAERALKRLAALFADDPELAEPFYANRKVPACGDLTWGDLAALRSSRPAPLLDGEVGELVARLRGLAKAFDEHSTTYSNLERSAAALSALSAERDALREALENLIEDAERQMKNPSHHMPFSLPSARALLCPAQDERSRENLRHNPTAPTTTGEG